MLEIRKRDLDEVRAALVTTRLAADPKGRIMSLDEACKRAGIKRPLKLLRMLRALWRVKDA